jgi:parvulin-like peptidyl-prolyl isomerase
MLFSMLAGQLRPGFSSEMRKNTLILLLVAIVALLAAGCGGGGNGDVSKDDVAVVGDQEITRAQFDQLLSQAKKSYATQKRQFPKAGTPEYEQLKNQAIQYLVQRAEFSQKAGDLDIDVSDKQVDDRLAQIKKQYFGNSDSKYQKQLKQQGLTEDQVREDIKAQLVSEAIFKKVTADVKVSDADVKKYYDEHKQQYGVPEQRDIAHILVKKKALADQLYQQVQAGANFSALAKKYSQDPGSKKQGGKLTVSKGQTVAPFDQTAFLLRTGQVSHPVKTEFGYHIIKALGPIKPAKTTPYKQVKESIRQQLGQQKKNEAMTKWVDDVKKEFAKKVHYQVGFAPPATATGATTTG